MSISQHFEVLKKWKRNLKSKVLIKTSFSLFLSLLTFLRLNSFSLFLILSATAFFLLSLSFSFSLAGPSFFFLSLSLSLFLRIDHAFIFFFSSICFYLVKKRLWRWFLSCVLIIFFCSSLSYFFSLQASTDAYKDMHLRFAVHLSIFVVDIFFFLVCQANWFFSLCFFQRSNGFFC